MFKIDADRLYKDLRAFEGEVLTVYHKCYIGVGHNLSFPVNINNTTYDLSTEIITKEESELLLQYDVNDVIERLDRSIGWVSDKTDIQRQALVHMGFNLGVPGLLQFKNMLAAVKDNNVRAIIAEATDSMWYKQIQPHRSAHVILQLCNETPSGDVSSQLTTVWECAPV